jgi:hypothetical protein
LTVLQVRLGQQASKALPAKLVRLEQSGQSGRKAKPVLPDRMVKLAQQEKQDL